MLPRFSPRSLTTLACILTWIVPAVLGDGPEGKDPDPGSKARTTDVEPAAESGRVAARKDLAAGRLVIQTGGLPHPAFDLYSRLLKERCGIELQLTHGCLVTAELVARRDAYNAVMKEAITRRYGEGILSRLWDEAQARWRREFEASETATGSQPGKPADTRKFHEVRSGETLTHIARRHGVGLAELTEANPGVDPRRLRIGQKLVVPTRPER